MKKWSYLKFLLFFLLLANEKIKAQPFNLDERIVPAELQFEDFKKEGEDKANGRISINKLVQENDTSYYFIKGLNMYSPTYFSLNSADAGVDITVNLCKENWHEVRHTGEVKGKSIWKTNFKTEGDFGIMVVAKKKPASYVLLVWTGNEMKVDMPSVFKNGTDGTGSNNSSGWFKKNMTVIIVAVVALLIIAFLLIKLKKKNP